MTGLLSQWIKDSEKFEMQRSYHVLNQDNYGFLNRQDDYYITLLNKMFFLLEDVKGNDYASVSEDLLEIAKGLLIYSDKDTQELFEHVDKQENMLYVATLYYLLGYEAIASLLLRDYEIDSINNVYGRLILYIIKGGYDKLPDSDNEQEKILFNDIDGYITTGLDFILTGLIEKVGKHCDELDFASLDEFFDCFILKHLLNKFSTDNLWYDLWNFDSTIDWSDYVDFSRSQGILQFLPSQRDAIRKGLLTYEKSFSLKMPTSAGKSYITELLIYSELKKNPDAKVLYLAPLRSLSHELSERYEKVGKALGFDSFAAYGGNSSTLDSTRLEETSLFITTPEFFASMEGGDEELLDKFTLVICDEGQLLDSIRRGTNYELLLSRIKSRGVARFLFISAIIPNIEDVNTWLGGSTAEVGDSCYRPCEIKLALADKNGRNISLHVFSPDLNNVKFDIEEFLNSQENRNVAINKKVTLCAALGLKSVSAGSTLIFTYSKGGKFGCQKVCDELLAITQMHRYGEHLIDADNETEVSNLFEYVAYQYGANYPLSIYLRNGFAYHNGGLPQDVREYIEDYYRRKWIKILVSNSTLAEGVNLPIRTLVVYNLRNYNHRTQRQELIPSTEIRNILGRVGRAGREKYGLAILPDYDNEVFSTVVEALRGDGIHAIRGIFYDVIQMLSRNHEELTDEFVNKVLIEIGASSAIDQMIYRHYGVAQEDVVENSISDSLAFHLSDNVSKNYIRQAFRVRHDRINACITDEEQFALLKQSGLELEDFLKLEETLKGDNLERFITDDVTDEEWLKTILETIYEMPTIESEKAHLTKKTIEVIENKTDYASFVSMWLKGKQYWQISKDLVMNLDHVMELLSHFQYHFHMRLQGLIRYLGAKYDFSDDQLSLLPECVKYGIHNIIQAALIKSGLRDRIAIHVVSQYIEDNELPSVMQGRIKRVLKRMGGEFENFVDELEIPQLSKDKIEVWLG